MTQSNLNQAAFDKAISGYRNVYHNAQFYTDKHKAALEEAISAYLECVGDGWLPIPRDDEDAALRGIGWPPADEVLLLAHYSEFDEKWYYEAGMQSCTRGGWSNGRATHYKLINTPPTTGDSEE